MTVPASTSAAQASIREATRRRTDAGRHDWRLEDEDLAAGAELFYWRGGLRAALRWLDGWRPREVVFSDWKAGRLARRPSGPIAIASPGACHQVAGPQKALFLAALWWEGAALPREVVQRLAPHVLRWLKRFPLGFSGFDLPRPDEEWACVSSSWPRRAVPTVRRYLKSSNALRPHCPSTHLGIGTTSHRVTFPCAGWYLKRRYKIATLLLTIFFRLA